MKSKVNHTLLKTISFVIIALIIYYSFAFFTTTHAQSNGIVKLLDDVEILKTAPDTYKINGRICFQNITIPNKFGIYQIYSGAGIDKSESLKYIAPVVAKPYCPSLNTTKGTPWNFSLFISGKSQIQSLCENRLHIITTHVGGPYEISSDKLALQLCTNIPNSTIYPTSPNSTPIISPRPTSSNNTPTSGQNPTPTIFLQTTPTPSNDNQDIKQVIQTVINSITESDIRTSLETISSKNDTTFDNRQTRFSSSTGYTEEAAYIANNLKNVGLTIKEQPWTKQTTRFGTISSKNIIARYNGKDTSHFYVVGAHFDSVGDLQYSKSGQSSSYDPLTDPAPGTDDNGSGSIVVYAIAKAIAQAKPQLNYSLEFVLFAGEEQGLLGSSKYASSVDPSSMAGAYIMDMVGYGPTRKCVKFIYRSSSTREKTLADTFVRMVSEYSLDLQTSAVAKQMPYSDHASFHQYSLDAVLGSDCGLIDNVNSVSSRSYYHDDSDTIANINIQQVVATARAIASSVLTLAK